jgi:hypothetical protein
VPLIKSKSKKAFGENVKKEMEAGKPMKQSLAIAFATKRKKKYKGGEIEGSSKDISSRLDNEVQEVDEMPHDRQKQFAYGGDVQDDVNEVFERDPDHDSMDDSDHFGRNESEDSLDMSEPLEEYKNIKDMYPDRYAEGGSIPEPELKNVNARSALGDHVEMLVDKCLATKGMNEREGFANGGYTGGTIDKDKAEQFEKGFGYEPEASPSPMGPSRKALTYDQAYKSMPYGPNDKIKSSPEAPYVPKKDEGIGNGPPPSGFSYGGEVEDLVNKCLAARGMDVREGFAKGGQIVEDNRANNNPMDQSYDDEGSNHMDDDILSQDDYMNKNMDHEDSMEPNKRKKSSIIAQVLEEVRKNNMRVQR